MDASRESCIALFLKQDMTFFSFSEPHQLLLKHVILLLMYLWGGPNVLLSNWLVKFDKYGNLIMSEMPFSKSFVVTSEKEFSSTHHFGYCVVPENIHTPPRKVTGNSEGEGGSKAEISEGSGGFIGSSFSRG